MCLSVPICSCSRCVSTERRLLLLFISGCSLCSDAGDKCGVSFSFVYEFPLFFFGGVLGFFFLSIFPF